MDWGQEEKGTTEDEMAGWHYQLDGHEFEWTLGVGDGQGGLACCDSWGHKQSDMTEWVNGTHWTELSSSIFNVLRILNSVLYMSSINLHSHRQCTGFPFLHIHKRNCYLLSFFSLGDGHFNWRRAWQPIQYSCLENPVGREAWWATVHRLHRFRHDWSDLALTATLTMRWHCIVVSYFFQFYWNITDIQYKLRYTEY